MMHLALTTTEMSQEGSVQHPRAEQWGGGGGGGGEEEEEEEEEEDGVRLYADEGADQQSRDINFSNPWLTVLSGWEERILSDQI